MKRFTGVMVLLLLTAASAQAQAPKKSNVKASGFMATAGMTKLFDMVEDNLMKTAEQVPEDKYSYRPTPEVRTLGQILGHVADAHIYFCNILAGTPKEYAVASEKLEGKAAITAALKSSFEACDAATTKLTDADLTKQVNVFGQDVPLSAALAFLTTHDWEHYGNLVTYMRLNGMTPPSSQQQ